MAGGLNGAQFYPSCYQITVAGNGSASPAGVSFPGAYKNTDPGILVDIHAKMSTYIDPGPTVYAGGVSKTPGNTKCTGQAASEGPGGKPATGVSHIYITYQALTKIDLNPQTLYTPGSGSGATSNPVSTTLQTSATSTSRSSPAATTTSSGGGGGCTVAKYGQCGGSNYNGCTTCAVSFLLSAMIDRTLICCAVWIYLPGQWLLLSVFIDGRERDMRVLQWQESGIRRNGSICGLLPICVSLLAKRLSFHYHRTV